MLEPRKLFPEAFGLEWGMSRQECRSALGDRASEEEGSISLHVQVSTDSGDQEVFLCFGSSAEGHGTGHFDSVQVWLDLSPDQDPNNLDEGGEPDGDDEEEWNTFYAQLENRQQSVRKLYQDVRTHFLQVLGPTDLLADERHLHEFDQEKAITGWRLPEGDLELMLYEENTSDWSFLYVRIFVYPPGSRSFHFAHQKTQPAREAAEPIRKHIPPPNLPATLPPPKPWWRFW